MKYIARLLSFSLLIVSSLFSACSEDPETPSPKPTIVSFLPSHGLVGETVIITGTNFSTTATENSVKFNGNSAVVTNATNTQLTTTVPIGATTGKLTLTISGNTTQSETDFIVDLPVVLPSIVSFSPSHGLVGETVIITGTNFSTSATENIVKFNGLTAVVTNATSTQLTTTVPTGATTGKLSLTVSGETIQSTTDFTVDPPPPIVCLLTKYTVVGSGYADEFYNVTNSTTFVYNDKGELIKYSSDDEYTTTFSYVDGLVTEVQTVYGDATTIEKWTYNTDKLASHVEGTITFLGIETLYTKDFAYNDAKKLISIHRTSDVSNYLMTFTYTGDNVTAYVVRDIDLDEEIENSTYADFDTKNNPFLLLAKATGDQAFFITEVTSPHLLSENNAKTVNSSEGNYSIAYEYDANENVIKQTITHAEGGKDVITFEYSCH
jgi:hypothetical protein